MSESTREERVQESGVVGHSFDTDDRIGDFDIYEALVNPHDGQGTGQKKGAGGPMMMPMGGAGGGSSNGSTTAAGTAAGAAAKGTSAASAGTGASAAGLAGTGGVAGFGSVGSGASGIGGGGLSGPGGGGVGLSGLGSGGLSSGSGSSWSMPTVGTGAAGISDPTLDIPGSVTGTGTGPGSGTGSGAGTTPTGGFTVPNVPTPTSTIHTPTVPGTNPGGTSPQIMAPSTTTQSASGVAMPAGGGAAGMSGGGGGASANTSALGVKTVTASPEMLHKEAQHWDDTAKEFTAHVTSPVRDQSPSSVDFGMMKDAFPSYNDLLNRLKTWSTQAGTEFSSISDALQSASGGYSDTEATNTTTASHAGIPE